MIRVTVHRMGYLDMPSPPMVEDSEEHQKFLADWSRSETLIGFSTEELTEYTVPVVVKVWAKSEDEAKTEVGETITYGMGGGFFIRHDDVIGWQHSDEWLEEQFKEEK